MKVRQAITFVLSFPQMISMDLVEEVIESFSFPDVRLHFGPTVFGTKESNATIYFSSNNHFRQRFDFGTPTKPT